MEPRYSFTEEEIHDRFEWLAELLGLAPNLLHVHPSTEPQWRQYRRRADASEFMLMHEDSGGTYPYRQRIAFKHRITRNYLFILRDPDGDKLRPFLVIPRTREPFMLGCFGTAPGYDERAHYRAEV